MKQHYRFWPALVVSSPDIIVPSPAIFTPCTGILGLPANIFPNILARIVDANIPKNPPFYLIPHFQLFQ